MKVAVVLVLCLGHLTLGANPNYSYHVKIEDAAHANYQEKAESRKGPDAQGFYSVVEPNGALRTVEYTADDRGFNPIVTYSHGHPGSHAAVYSSASYAPAFVSDKRVQIVDKLVGAPPALNIQPFALPAPSGYPGPVVVPAPLRVAPAPQLIAEAQGVNYAPAYMPPVTAFQPQRAYLPPPPQQQVVYHEAPRPVAVPVPAPQQVVYEAPRPVAVPVPQAQVVYEAPRPQVVYEEAPRPAVIAVEKPAPVVKVVEAPAPVVVDSYAAPPRDTVINPNAPVYPDAIKVVEKPDNVYGPPNLVPGKPLGLDTYAPAAKVEVVQQAVKIERPVQYLQPVPPVRVVEQKAVKVVQPVQVQEFVQPAPIKYVQQPQYVAPAPVVKVAAAPVVGLYAGAIGYHNQNSAGDHYLHSYGTQGFQVTSSRKYNHGFISAPVVQKQVVQPQLVQQVVQPQPQIIQQTYAPQYLPPAPQVHVQQVQPIRQVVAAPPPAIIQQTYAPQYLPPAPQVHVQQVQPIRQVVAAPPPVYGAPAKLVQPVAIAAGKKQNPLTFAYSYDQGGAKVSHSYSGSGW